MSYPNSALRALSNSDSGPIAVVLLKFKINVISVIRGYPDLQPPPFRAFWTIKGDFDNPFWMMLHCECSKLCP